MNIQNAITIDLTRPGISHRTYAVEGDRGTRTVQLLLRQGAGEWTVPDGVAASVVYSKSDGTRGWYDTLPDGTPACTVDGSAITVTLVPQIMAVSGIVVAAVILRDQDKNQLSTFDFLVDVRSSPADDAVSENYYNLQADAFSGELAEWMAQMEQALAGAVQFAQAQVLTEEQQAQARENIGAVSAGDVSAAIEEAVGEAIVSTVFRPSVDADGNLSWTNNAGLENPAAVNVMGPQGPAGENGQDGADGCTPVKGTDYFTDDDKAELVDLVLAALPAWEGGAY